MNLVDAATLSQVTGGSLVGGDPSCTVSGVSTDTRTIQPGDLFVALRGERFDGNQFAASAAAAGASVLLVERWEGEMPASAAVVQVADGLLALQRLAHWHRHRLDLPVLGITGSNGKTSTKDFARAVLSRRGPVLATKGNLNNHIGVPLTVLSIDDSHTAAVVEMGMNHAGEIAPLCEIAMPRFGIITNIGTAHIENLGSREAIAEEKGALARALPGDGTLFVPAGCDFFDYFRSRTKARVVPVGNGRGLIRAENLAQADGRTRFTLVIEDDSAAEVDLPVLGRHMVKNSLLAAGCGWVLGMDAEEIAAGLSSASLTSGRLRQYESGGVIVFDDTYNANPESMAAAIETLAETPLPNGGHRYAVLGPMGELGSHGPAAHRDVGRLAAEAGVIVIAVGEAAAGIAEGANADLIADPAEAATEIARRTRPGDAVLFKASRSAAMEQVMNQAFPPQD
ncbi:UDP-N-acetylmuramoyl-tripeptide--D-alanyl-D-alanine ligase [Haloferula sp. A504]|uniref:UDP-N-acetylmuramoyl-tripeptide--D-alanyl-D- alanine ligase n=1 Tax=Haloferula sp. A504 TaxID=3373601 RepID=UPI0031BD4F4A|nr:UDP-N-acetylmuramoyl-tripeptide--D-alanyl-D-alanine ligase [Verrucomicrobiaceae bacterium E54]